MKNILHEETHIGGEAPQYKRPRRRRTGRIVTFIVLVSIALLLIVGGLGVGVRMLNLGAGAQPTLIVTNDEGFVHVRPGTGKLEGSGKSRCE